MKSLIEKWTKDTKTHYSQKRNLSHYADGKMFNLRIYELKQNKEFFNLLRLATIKKFVLYCLKSGLNHSDKM